MPRKQPIEAPAPKKRGHLFDKLGEPKPKRKSPPKRPFRPTSQLLIKETGKGVKPNRPQKSRNPMGTNKVIPPPPTRTKPHRATKAAGTWTPRKVGNIHHKPHKYQPKTYTDETIAAALYEAKGLTYAAAQILGMDYSHACQRINKSPVLQKVRQDAIERRLDIAEVTLDDLVARPGPSQLGATCFFLKCRGKQRGYVERQELEQTNAPIDLNNMNDDQLTALVEAIGRKLEERAS